MTEQEAKILISEFEQTDLLESEKYKNENPAKWVQYCVWYNCINKKYTQDNIITILKSINIEVT